MAGHQFSAGLCGDAQLLSSLGTCCDFTGLIYYRGTGSASCHCGIPSSNLTSAKSFPLSLSGNFCPFFTDTGKGRPSPVLLWGFRELLELPHAVPLSPAAFSALLLCSIVAHARLLLPGACDGWRAVHSSWSISLLQRPSLYLLLLHPPLTLKEKERHRTFHTRGQSHFASFCSLEVLISSTW